MGHKGGEGRIEQWSARFPAQYNGFLAVVKTLGGNSGKIGKGVLMAANQREEIPTLGKIYELAPGESKDIGKTL